MRVDRRRFQQVLLMGAACQLLPAGKRLLALSPDWRDLAQPFAAQVQRLLAAMETIGEPLPPAAMATLSTILARPLAPDTVDRMDAILQSHTLIKVDINPESRVSVSRGPAPALLVEHGWRSFLVRITNQSNDTSVLQFRSPQGGRMGRPSASETTSAHDFTIGAVDAVEAQSRWISLITWDKPPLQPALSGLALEYRILQIYSRDRGRREASLQAVTGTGTQDLGYRSTIAILFDCVASHAIKLNIHDSSEASQTASLVITDKLGRVYPTQAKRALPDLWFQPQIYRRSGESLELPQGSYSIMCGRGPEYLQKTVALDVHEGTPSSLELPLERWVIPGDFGYYSGDPHIHAAGCSHYESPSEGVPPEVMLRQVEGEALDVGASLTWAPGFLYQSQFFSGHVYHAMDAIGQMHAAARPRELAPVESILRYDLEVSGFPSSHCGHLVLLKLTEQKYPGTTMPDDWPSWNLPILKWAKAQGAITGYAHSGWGMVVDSVELPNYVIPPFDSCGANEYLVDVTHPGMLDFISGCDLWPFAELNLWYHVLNCGFKLKFAGETDFPCITDKCVGGGRSYAKLASPPVGDHGYSDWLISGLQSGESYFGDGRSHIFNLAVEGAAAGPAPDEFVCASSSKVRVSAQVCARLEPEITAATDHIRSRSPYDQPYWHLERSRIGSSLKIPVELIVNGRSHQRTEVQADGQVHPVSFELPLTESCWIALRIYPSSHTNPLTLLVGNTPVRASRKSVEWCRRGVDVCWDQKALRIRPAELADAKAAYDHARATYDRILSETQP